MKENLCNSGGLFSTCNGKRSLDRQSCCHFEGNTDCSHYRAQFGGHCDSVAAQYNEPIKEVQDTETEEIDFSELTLDDLILDEGKQYQLFNSFANAHSSPPLKIRP